MNENASGQWLDLRGILAVAMKALSSTRTFGIDHGDAGARFVCTIPRGNRGGNHYQYPRLCRIVLVVTLFSATVRAGDAPSRVSIAPKNDLSAIVYTPPPGGGFGSSVCGTDLSKEYEEGYRIGAKNDHFGRRNRLTVDDGKSTFPAADKETGLPLIVLTDAKITKELQDLVRGYNAAMLQAFERRKKQASR
jgi:hypothetical protein